MMTVSLFELLAAFAITFVVGVLFGKISSTPCSVIHNA
jgi:hypothetical protein